MTTAILMAGGEGLRCRPLTLHAPKPMLPVGGKPVLETLVRQLAKAGTERIFIVVRYLKEQIVAAVPGWAQEYGVEVRWLQEPVPFGTAGGLSLIPDALRPTEPFLVVNADILCPLDFAAFREFHIAHGNLLTLVGREHAYALPYGWPMVSGPSVVDFREKPTFTYRVNSGIYCLEPHLLDVVPRGYYDMPDLIRWACQRGNVGLYPLDVPYHEIGSVENYHAAEEFYGRWMR